MATDADYLTCHEKFVEFAAELAECGSARPLTGAGRLSDGADPECAVAPHHLRWLRPPTAGGPWM